MTQTTLGPATGGPLKRFFTNQTRFDFIGRSRMWLQVSVALVLIAGIGLAVRGLNFGIEFTGGTAFIITGADDTFTAEDLRDALGEVGLATQDVVVQVISDEAGQGALVTTPALDAVGGEQEAAVVTLLADVTGVDRATIDVEAVGPRWGAHISRQALQALVVFLALVVLYITLRFEWRAALAALVTLVHDVLITIGVYAIVGFQVSPASVIAVLTILGYSLYDTIVVFDRVSEETGRITSVSNQTYGEVANRAVNEVLLRSLSTSVTSLLPVGSLLFIGAQLLGADTLQDLALALFVGMAVGTYSSVVVASPLLVWLKEKEPRYAELKEKVLARRGKATA